MTRRAKISLLALTGVAAIGLLLWMRSLASWRPVKIGELPGHTSVPLCVVHFLSSDGKTAFVSAGGVPTILDVQSGRQINWPLKNSSDAYPVFSPYAPNLVFTLKLARQKSVEVRELRTGHLKRIFRWPKTQFNSQLVCAHNSNRVGVVEGDVFYQWDITTGQRLRQLQLDIRTMPGDSAAYAISPDARRLVGCSDNRCGTWDTSTGQNLGSCKIRSFGVPILFFDNGRALAYSFDGRCLDTTTGKLKWKSPNYNSTGYFYSSMGDELLLGNSSGCDILDVHSGRPKRHIPGPRLSDGQILRATSDYIYTVRYAQSRRGEIFRWRAR